MGVTMLVFTIISICVNIIRLIVSLRKKDPELAAKCMVAMSEAKKNKDLSKLQQLLHDLQGKMKDDQCR